MQLSKPIDRILADMRNHPAGMRFADVVRVCQHYFPPGRIEGGHHIFSVPWVGYPLNLQREKNGKAIGYQVRQVVAAVDRLLRERGE